MRTAQIVNEPRMFVYTGGSAVCCFTAISGKIDNSANGQLIYVLIKHLVSVRAHHDWIILFSVHVKQWILNFRSITVKFRLKIFAHVNRASETMMD